MTRNWQTHENKESPDDKKASQWIKCMTYKKEGQWAKDTYNKGNFTCKKCADEQNSKIQRSSEKSKRKITNEQDWIRRGQRRARARLKQDQSQKETEEAEWNKERIERIETYF